MEIFKGVVIVFSKLSKLVNTGVPALPADRNIPVAEEIINVALSNFAQDIPEISALALDIQEGSFEMLVEGKKFLTLKSRTRFEISSCEISAEKQIVTFRRISPTELSADKLTDRILVMVFKAIACGIFQVEPAQFVLEGQPGITVDGDNYTVDLSKTVISERVSAKVQGILSVAGSFLRVKELRCAPKQLQVVIGADSDSQKIFGSPLFPLSLIGTVCFPPVVDAHAIKGRVSTIKVAQKRESQEG